MMKMINMAMKLRPLFLVLIILLTFSSSLSYAQIHSHENVNLPSSYGYSPGMKRLVLQETSKDGDKSGNKSMILAEKETYRLDPLDNFNYYRGGWNISDIHYWASVGYTCVPFASVAALWFVLCGLFLLCTCICCCCFRRNKPYGYSRLAYALSLIFLILFTIAAIVGCAIMYSGEGRFQGSLNDVIRYIINQGISIVNNLLSIFRYLSSAKNIVLNKQFLPPELTTEIDNVNSLINATVNIPHLKSSHFTDAVLNILNPVNAALICITVLLLLLAFLGFLFSILGMKSCVYLFVVIGWIIITLTFSLCGIFLIFHNVVSDTCVAMDEWVQNPMANSSMKELLPCWNRESGQHVLNATTSVSSGINDMLNQYIELAANNNTVGPQAEVVALYHNQSGPLVPFICDPNTKQSCREDEVTVSNAAEEWKTYVCQVSADGICTTPGRLTPDMYNHMASAVNVSFGLYNYSAFLASLVDCTVIQDTFKDISQNHCPGLRRYSQWVYIGLVTATGSVMFSLIIWVLYARERRHRKYTKRINKGYDESPLVGGRKL